MRVRLCVQARLLPLMKVHTCPNFQINRFRTSSNILMKAGANRKDKGYRRYASNVERALSLFDTALQEWADYISFLGRLLKVLCPLRIQKTWAYVHVLGTSIQAVWHQRCAI